jgi:ribonuclease HI
MAELVILVDGSCKRNPGGECGRGGVVYSPWEDEPLVAWTDSLGSGTNNEAEWQAFIAGLEMAIGVRCETLTLNCDSQLVIRQFSGEYAVKKAHLQKFYLRAKELAKQIPHLKVEWMPREKTKAADAASRPGG